MAYDERTMRDIQTLRGWIRDCEPGRMVFFGGAGVSVESGIPDFRSSSGIFMQKYPIPPEEVVSRSFFLEHPREFYDFYFDRMIFVDAQPNRAHNTLAALERKGTLSAVVTQNIDGLHQAAGSSNVCELHGSVHRNYCMTCGNTFDLAEVLALHEASDDGIPRCPSCGGMVRPDVVLYEEGLDDQVIRASVQAIADADLLLIAGTSLAVYPAAGLIDYFSGSHLIIVNKSPTPRDRHADLCIAASIGDALDFNVDDN